MPNGVGKTYQYGPINRPYKTTISTKTPIELETLYHLSKRNGENQSDYRTTQIYQETLGGTQYRYSYDKLGNITEIQTCGSSGEFSKFVTYHYDELNQLIREDNIYTGKTKVYTYDNGENLLKETEYPYTTGTPGTPTATNSYGYSDGNWKDKLTSYNGEPITYDAIGNPLSYRGNTLTWQNGQELKSLTNNKTKISYQYDSDGIRTQKIVNGEHIDYYYLGNQLLYENRESGLELYYFYDGNDELSGIRYVTKGESNDYIVVTNWRGDVEALYDLNGTLIAQYTYDAWGKQISIQDRNGNEITNQTHIANVNPFRYRGYYFDTDTSLYYLMSRYYDPETRRMINSDDDVSIVTLENLTDKNYFSYCDNNPIQRADGEGDFWHIVVGAALGATIGSATSAVSQYVSTGKIDMKRLGLAALTGAIGGGCAATGIPMVGQIAIGAALGGTGNIAEQLLCDGKYINEIDLKDVAVNTAVGAVAGAAGGRGADHYSQSMNRAGKQVTKNVTNALKKGSLKTAKRKIITYKKIRA